MSASVSTSTAGNESNNAKVLRIGLEAERARRMEAENVLNDERRYIS